MVDLARGAVALAVVPQVHLVDVRQQMLLIGLLQCFGEGSRVVGHIRSRDVELGEIGFEEVELSKRAFVPAGDLGKYEADQRRDGQ